MTDISKEVLPVNSPVLSVFEAGAYLRINDGELDSLRVSRSTGELWGYPAPLFIKAKRKVLYRKVDLDAFLAQIPTIRCNSEDKGVQS